VEIIIFYTICSIVWIVEFFFWFKAFKLKNQKSFVLSFIIMTIGSAIMHVLGIITTQANYEPEKADFLILLGVPGFDMIQITIFIIALLINKINKK